MKILNTKVLSITLALWLMCCLNSFSTTVNVSISGLSFSPSTVNVSIGDTVKWTWLNGNHTTTCDGSSFTSRPLGAASWNAPMNSGNPSFKYVVSVAGTYNYKCTFHAPSMVGVINATAPSTFLNLTAIIEGFWDGSVMTNDTVKVFLHNSTSPFAKVDSAKVKLNNSGNGLLTFSHAAAGSYYIVVTHRNSIETWSKFSQAFTPGLTTTYNFTSSADKAFGDNLKFKLGKFTIYSGDVNLDGTVDATDLIEVYNDNLLAGYVRTDVNGDNFVDVSDLIITYNNSLIVASVIRP